MKIDSGLPAEHKDHLPLTDSTDNALKLVEAVEDGIKAGLLPKTSASEIGAAKYSAQVRAADRLRDALAALSPTGGNDVPQVQKPADSPSASDASGVTGGNADG